MSSIVGKNDGLFDPSARFAFTNITTEDFVSAWDGNPVTIKPGQTVELQHHLANKFTDELVDKIMIGAAKLDEVTYYKNNPNTRPNDYRAPSSLGVPAARQVWEDQIIRKLEVDEESPEIQIMRAQIKEDLLKDLAAEPSKEPVAAPTSVSEFAELNEGIKPAPIEKKPLKMKEIKVT